MLFSALHTRATLVSYTCHAWNVSMRLTKPHAPCAGVLEWEGEQLHFYTGVRFWRTFAGCTNAYRGISISMIIVNVPFLFEFQLMTGRGLASNIR